jgi:hypothetical protein
MRAKLDCVFIAVLVGGQFLIHSLQCGLIYFIKIDGFEDFLAANNRIVWWILCTVIIVVYTIITWRANLGGADLLINLAHTMMIIIVAHALILLVYLYINPNDNFGTIIVPLGVVLLLPAMLSSLIAAVVVTLLIRVIRN